MRFVYYFSATFTILDKYLIFFQTFYRKAYSEIVIKYIYNFILLVIEFEKIKTLFYKSHRGPQILEMGLGVKTLSVPLRL
jgi:hypothetical protein